jgi:epoxyqueuosine reductase
MNAKRIIEGLTKKLASADFKCTFISAQHLPDLRRDLEKLLEEGTLKREFYDEIVSRLELYWHFDATAYFPQAESVIIAMVFQPKTSLGFELSGKKYYAIIPPTYIYNTDKQVVDIMSPYLEKYGYNIGDALLPTKLLAVRSGMAKYGRNNITYADGWGSYYRLRAFFSNLPCTDDHWQEPEAMDLCSECTACIAKCPTHAISRDRFLIDADKCLTFFNEASHEFPRWLDPTWHNCLVGCMICQDVCPANKNHTSWTMPGGDFSEEETVMILDGVAQDRLPKNTAVKLQRVNMLDYYSLLKRNLGVLIENQREGVGK